MISLGRSFTALRLFTTPFIDEFQKFLNEQMVASRPNFKEGD